jgi:hypothetical protein
MQALLLGLGHRARHGKDTFAMMVHARLPRDSRIYSFADDLKAYCRVCYGMTTKDSVLLQREGQRFRREKDLDFWIRLVQLKIEEHEESIQRPHIAIIPDMRYANEYAWVKANSGITVKIKRLNPDGSLYIDPSRPSDHPSETELESVPFDFEVVAESGDFAALENAADHIAQLLKERLILRQKEYL